MTNKTDYSEQMRKSYNVIAKSYADKSYKDSFYEEQKAHFVSLLKEKGKVLDVGCGGGQDSLYFYSKGFSVMGIDISDEMVSYAKKKLPAGTFYAGNFVDVPLNDAFDGIWCNRVFHHIPLDQQDAFLSKIHRLLKENGVLYLSAELTDEQQDVDLWKTGVFPEHEGGDDIPIFKKLLTKDSFYSLLKKHRFEIFKTADWGKSGFTEVFARKL